MKSIIKSIALSLCLVCILANTQSLTAQPPAPPSEHGLNGNQGAGGEAPVGEGIVILMIGVAGYGLVRYRQAGRAKKI